MEKKKREKSLEILQSNQEAKCQEFTTFLKVNYVHLYCTHINQVCGFPITFSSNGITAPQRNDWSQDWGRERTGHIWNILDQKVRKCSKKDVDMLKGHGALSFLSVT